MRLINIFKTLHEPKTQSDDKLLTLDYQMTIEPTIYIH